MGVASSSAAGRTRTTCVELVRTDTERSLLRAPAGSKRRTCAAWSSICSTCQGKEIFIRLVDQHTGDWGHVNFDDFRFHAEKPNVPAAAEGQPPPTPDVYKYAGLPPEKAAEAMTVPEGFTVTLFAGEPDVHAADRLLPRRPRPALGRRSVHAIPIRRPEGKEAKDRILIFEDTDGDGKFDKRTVFMEGLNLVSGLEVGFGGVWVGAAPYLLFIPIKDGDDKPAGPPQILLDGWGYQDTHETLNTFTWGPDGWLYGCHGVFTHSQRRQAGHAGRTSARRSTPASGAITRRGTSSRSSPRARSNPWGLDFDDHGQASSRRASSRTASTSSRAAATSGRRASTSTRTPTTTSRRSPTTCTTSGANPHGGNNRSDAAGGGHAHCGLMFYLGGAWPEEYRGQLFMGNIHGQRSTWTC